MPNLIDQMDILKNLPDGALAGELSQPSGAVPPYLVLSEVNRRKDMRQRFAGQAAMQKPQTTVAQDASASLAPPTPSARNMGAAAGQGAPMAMPGGVGSSPAMPGAPVPAPTGIAAAGYARGGIVGYAKGGYTGNLNDLIPPEPTYINGVPAPALGIAGAPPAVALNTYGYDPTRDPAINYGGTPAGAGIAAAIPQGASGIPAVADAPAGPTTMQDGVTGTPMDLASASDTGAVSLPPIGQDYSKEQAQYQKQLDDANAAKSRDPWLALMQAGLAIAGGTSPYALTNIGQGGAEGLNTYAALSKSDAAAKEAALAGLMGISKQKTADQIATVDQANEAAKIAMQNDPNSLQNTPPAIREAQIINAMPENTPEERAAKDAAMKIVTPFAAQNAETKASQADIIAEGIHSGDVLPPTTLGTGGQGAAIQAAFLRKFPGENLAKLQLDAKSAQTWAQHMNSGQIIKQQTNLSVADDQLTKLQSLADQWKAGNFPDLNSLVFKSALHNGLGPEAQTLASQFQQQLADTKLTMQQVFAGGYAGTDKQLSEIDNMFATAAPERTFDDLINLARINVKYRAKALTSPQAMGVGGLGTNAYAQSNGNPGAAAAAASAPVTKTVDGQVYTSPDGGSSWYAQ